jgi:hypothetical protein
MYDNIYTPFETGKKALITRDGGDIHIHTAIDFLIDG